MKPYNDFTLVFQGPLHKNFIYGLLNNYKEYTDNIIISHWDTDDLELLKYLSEYNIKCKIITNKFQKNYNVFNGQNVYYQVLTSLTGLQEVKTKYAIKMRTDQWFGNLIPMFNAVMSHPEKYTCANLHFRPDKFLKYHPSDKLIGADSKILLNTFETALYRLKNNVLSIMAGAYMYTDNQNLVDKETLENDIGIYSYSDINRKIITQYPELPLFGTIQILPGAYIGLVPEMIIGTSYLLARNIYPSPEKSIEIVKKNFEIVKVENMFPYVNKEGNDVVEHNSIEINNIDEYDI